MSRLLVITKFRYMGDTIVATPFLRRLKEALPDADVTLLSGPAAPALMQGCPYLRRVCAFDGRRDGRIAGTLRLARRMRRERYDSAFLLNRSFHSALLALLAGIPARIGFDTEGRGRLLTRRVRYGWDRPERDLLMDLLRAEGLSAEDALPELWVSQDERDLARALLRERGVPCQDRLIGMQPGANDPHVREWGAERYAQVADRLVDEGAACVLMGGPDERQVALRTAAAMRRESVTLAGETGLREALAVISLCRLWIGNDGGLLHAAVALGPSTVGIFGPTKASRWSYDTPRHRTMVVHPESPRGTAAEIRACLDAISPESVYEAASELLERSPV